MVRWVIEFWIQMHLNKVKAFYVHNNFITGSLGEFMPISRQGLSSFKKLS